MKILKQKLNKKQKGFVSMVALLLANVFLVVGLSVFGIALREVVLSSGARESLFAFYAADGGMECALYWDIKEKAFSDGTLLSEIDCIDDPTVVVTNNQNYSGCEIEGVLFTVGLPCDQSTFKLSYSSGAEVYVEVYKYDNKDTLIRSFGRNTADINNQRRVERAWQVIY